MMVFLVKVLLHLRNVQKPIGDNEWMVVSFWMGNHFNGSVFSLAEAVLFDSFEHGDDLKGIVCNAHVTYVGGLNKRLD